VLAALWPQILARLESKVADPFYAAAITEAVTRFDDVWVLGCAAGAFALALFGWLAASRRRPIASGEVAWALSSIIVMIVLGPGLIGRTIEAIQRPIVEAAERASVRKLDVVMWGIDVPSFAVLTSVRVTRRDPRPGELVLTKTRRRPDLVPIATVDEVVYERADVSLLRLGTAPD
jgi:hypothetical protein